MNLNPSSTNPPLQPEDALPRLKTVSAGSSDPDSENPPLLVPSAPSILYRTGLWRMGLFLARWLPVSLSRSGARILASLYASTRVGRREVVVQNLLPLLDRDLQLAERCARRLFRQFAVKLVDLLRFEASGRVDHLFDELTGWDHFLAARNGGRGVLIVTPHLGNWEFGGPLLTGRGFSLNVVTMTEPGAGLTELRQASRARWGIETLVIADDPFAFVEIIRKLEAGANVALLIDRPPPPSAVTVELFGQPFQASIAAAELARASGCAVLPVYVPRTRNGYAAHILPPIHYERPALRDREARREFTREIIRVFEPAIKQHPDQWYHFVPIWPSAR